MNLHEQILEYIDRLLHPLLFFEILQLKTNLSIELISRIIKESNKTIPEAVSVFITVVRHLCKDLSLLQKFIKDNSDLICKMAIEKRVQSNFPSRALPLFEIFGKKIKDSPISVIELGASFGLIGRCMLNPRKIVEKKDNYFFPKQQMPRDPLPIDYYLGIEIDPPDESWLFSCLWPSDYQLYLKNFLQDIPANEKFKLQKGNAFGFSKLKVVRDLVSRTFAVVVLTSFMLYQYDDKTQKLLKDEILEFTERGNRHWINQTLNGLSMEYFIEFDGEKIIELTDGTCTSWKWLRGEGK